MGLLIARIPGRKANCGEEEEGDEAGDLQVAQGEEGSRASRVEVDEGARAPHGIPVLMPRKNSLVGNINRRKKLGISRPKSKSTVSKKAFAAMKKGWR